MSAPARSALTEAELDELVAEALKDAPPPAASAQEQLGARFDRGLAWINFRRGLGGLGLGSALQGAVNERFRAAGSADPMQLNIVGYGTVAHVLHAHASDELNERLLRPLFLAEEIWCQLFSEPGAGSDLAGLATSARPDGSGWRIDGHKVWTTRGQEARWAILLARTDPDLPKHRGLTFFVLDMHAEGVEVRPLRQMTGDSEFNEVRLAGVHVPDSYRVGDIGQGWAVAMTTLSNERNVVGDGAAAAGSGSIGLALRLWAERPQDQTPYLRERLLSLALRAEAVRLTSARYAAGRVGVGSENSTTKISVAAVEQDILEFCMDLLGPDASVFDDRGIDPAVRDTAQWQLLRSRARSIEGGTSEVLRNVVAERVLGLPGDIRVDKNRPWREVPRG